MLLYPFATRVIGKSGLEIGQFLRRNFWMISGGPFLSRPLCFTAEQIVFQRANHWAAQKMVLFVRRAMENVRKSSFLLARLQKLVGEFSFLQGNLVGNLAGISRVVFQTLKAKDQTFPEKFEAFFIGEVP